MDIKLPQIPGVLDLNYHYTIDYGGSVIKIVYRKNDARGQEALYMRSFSMGEHQQLFSFVSTLEKHPTSELIVTGVGCMRYNSELQEGLGVKLNVVPEYGCFELGLKSLIRHLPYSELFATIPETSFTRALVIAQQIAKMQEVTSQTKDESSVNFSSGDDHPMFGSEMFKSSNEEIMASYHEKYKNDPTSVFPCLVAMYGSGNAVYKMESLDSPIQMVGYSPRAGRTLIGLGSLLTGGADFDELMDLASQGEPGNVDEYIRKLKGGEVDNFYSLFPDDCLCFCFGQTYKKTIDDFRREDLAAAVVSLIAEDTAQNAIQWAQISDMKNIVFCGSPLGHEYMRKTIAKSFLNLSLNMPLKIQPTMHICTLGSHIGALGVWLMAQKQSQCNTQ